MTKRASTAHPGSFVAHILDKDIGPHLCYSFIHLRLTHAQLSYVTNSTLLTRSSFYPFLNTVKMTGGKSGGKASGSKNSQSYAKTTSLSSSPADMNSRSSKAGLAFPVGRVHRLLRKGNYAQRVGAGTLPFQMVTATMLTA